MASVTLCSNTTMSPSPALETMRPLFSAIAFCNSAMSRWVKASNSSSPRRARRSVDATRSQTRIVITRDRAITPPRRTTVCEALSRASAGRESDP
jgi:hypothetical protein